MSDKLITADQAISADELATLNALLDYLLPKDESRGLPAASETDIVKNLIEDSELLGEVLQAVLELDAETNGFVALSQSDRAQVLGEKFESDPQYLKSLVRHALIDYYRDPVVLRAIGSRPGAPFPEGYTDFVKRGDLSLLDPVRQRGSIYRPA